MAIIQKALGGEEDLLFGQGTVTQTRGGGNVTISKINADTIPYSGDFVTSDMVSIKTTIDANTADIATNTAKIATSIAVVATGTGAQTTFAVPATPLAIYINGVYQNKSTYTVAGGNVVFSEAPPITSVIEFLN